jgi:hypothetical protein
VSLSSTPTTVVSAPNQRIGFVSITGNTGANACTLATFIGDNPGISSGQVSQQASSGAITVTFSSPNVVATTTVSGSYTVRIWYLL